MNLFVSIEEFLEFRKVKYYSIRVEDCENCETDNFFQKFLDSNYTKDLEVIKELIEKIGEERGAEERYFRAEKNARALPHFKGNKLRLYCIRVSNDIVILGNGDVKTARSAQDCPNVGPIFNFINKVESEFTKKVREKDIMVKDKNLDGDLHLEIVY